MNKDVVVDPGADPLLLVHAAGRQEQAILHPSYSAPLLVMRYFCPANRECNPRQTKCLVFKIID